MDIQIGQTVNYWKVLEDLGMLEMSGKRRHFYRCECLGCGTIKDVRSDNLKSNHSNGCGCIKKRKTKDSWKLIDCQDRDIEKIHFKNSLLGQKMGDYTIIELDHSNKTGGMYYKGINSKGETKILRKDSWEHHYNQGIINNYDGIWRENLREKSDYMLKQENASSLEQSVYNWLKENNYEFHMQYTFEDLIRKNKLRFDFCVIKNDKKIFIEVQGPQHFKPIKFFGGEEGLRDLQLRDNLKAEYCKKKGYKLIIITEENIKNLEWLRNQII